MKRLADSLILAISILGLAYFVAPDVAAWIAAGAPIGIAGPVTIGGR